MCRRPLRPCFFLPLRQVHDVVVALDGELLNERALADVIKPGQQTVQLAILRPGPPYVNPNLKQAVVQVPGPTIEPLLMSPR